MKKRIIITALSVMLASSSIIPAYAAGYGYEIEFENVMQAWADQYRDAILSIEGEAPRYDFIFKTVTEDFSIKGPGLQHITIDDFRQGRISCVEYTICIRLLCDIAGIENHVVDGWNGVGDEGINHAWALVKIDGTYYYSDAMRADNNQDYNESKLSKILWPTFTGRAGQLWTAAEYLEKDAAEYAQRRAEDANTTWVKSSDIDWSDPTKQYDEVIYIRPESVNE